MTGRKSAKKPPKPQTRRLLSWEVSDALWKRVGPLLPKPPKPKYRYRFGKKGLAGGRKRLDDRRIFSGILYVLRTGCQWKAVPQQYGSGSAVHGRFQEWEEAGVWKTLWRRGLAEYDEMEGIAWRWLSADGSMGKAPLGGEATGRNPTDRGKKRDQAARADRRPWSPAFPRRDRGQPA